MLPHLTLCTSQGEQASPAQEHLQGVLRLCELSVPGQQNVKLLSHKTAFEREARAVTKEEDIARVTKAFETQLSLYTNIHASVKKYLVDFKKAVKIKQKEEDHVAKAEKERKEKADKEAAAEQGKNLADTRYQESVRGFSSPVVSEGFVKKLETLQPGQAMKSMTMNKGIPSPMIVDWSGEKAFMSTQLDMTTSAWDKALQKRCLSQNSIAEEASLSVPMGLNELKDLKNNTFDMEAIMVEGIPGKMKPWFDSGCCNGVQTYSFTSDTRISHSGFWILHSGL